MLLDLADMQGMLKPLFSKFKENEKVTIYPFDVFICCSHFNNKHIIIIIWTKTVHS